MQTLRRSSAAYDLTRKEQFAAGWIGSKRTLLITPTTAQVLAEGGYPSKESLKTALAKTARIVTHPWAFSKVHGSFGTIYGPFEEELAKTMAEPRAEKGKLPPWYPRFAGWEEIKTTPSVANPSDLEILILGDPSRNKVQILSAGGYHTIQIKLPGNWDELMKTAGYRPLSEFFLSAPKN